MFLVLLILLYRLKFIVFSLNFYLCNSLLFILWISISFIIVLFPFPILMNDCGFYDINLREINFLLSNFNFILKIPSSFFGTLSKQIHFTIYLFVYMSYMLQTLGYFFHLSYFEVNEVLNHLYTKFFSIFLIHFLMIWEEGNEFLLMIFF